MTDINIELCPRTLQGQRCRIASRSPWKNSFKYCSSNYIQYLYRYTIFISSTDSSQSLPCPFLTGRPGSPGPKGMGGNTGIRPNRGHFITRHSQSRNVPSCPQGTVELWRGFSILFSMGNGHAHHQDLGRFLMSCTMQPQIKSLREHV